MASITPLSFVRLPARGQRRDSPPVPTYGICMYQTACGRFRIIKQTVDYCPRPIGSWHIAPMAHASAAPAAIVATESGLTQENFPTRREAVAILQRLQDDGVFDVE